MKEDELGLDVAFGLALEGVVVESKERLVSFLQSNGKDHKTLHGVGVFRVKQLRRTGGPVAAVG